MAIRVPIDAREAGGGDDEFGPDRHFGEMWQDRVFLRRYCERIVGDTATAEDIVQETYVRALHNIDQIDRRASFVPWLATVARNLSFNEARRRGRHPVVDEVPDVAGTAETDPAELFDHDERVRELLSGLTPRERKLLMQQATEGLSISELAAQEHSTVGAVRSVLLRARAKVRTALESGVNILVPVAALFRRMRRRLDESAIRVQQMGPTSMAAAERSADVFTAAVAAATLSIIGVPVAGAAASTPDVPSGDPVEVAGAGSVSGSPGGTVDGDGRWLGFGAGPPDGGAAVGTPVSWHSDGDGPDVSGASSPDPLGTNDGPLPDLPVDPGETPDPDDPPPPDDYPVTTPEDAEFSDFAVVGGGAEVFAIGVNRRGCTTSQCDVLFHSTDAGVTWTALPAQDLDATELFVAPAYPVDSRIFALGESGLQVSTDGGSSFKQVSAPVPYGPAAMSPRFGSGDDTILVGAAPTWAYDAARDVTRPLAAAGFASPESYFAYPTTDDGSGRFYAGSLTANENGVRKAAVFRCAGSACTESTMLPGASVAPNVTSLKVGDAEVVLAWTDTRLWRSDDAGVTFTEVTVPATRIKDFTVDQSGTIFAAYTTPVDAPAGGILKSADGGRTWGTATASDAFATGSTDIVAVGDRLIAAGRTESVGGLQCSQDGGATWAQRCH